MKGVAIAIISKIRDTSSVITPLIKSNIEPAFDFSPSQSAGFYYNMCQCISFYQIKGSFKTENNRYPTHDDLGEAKMDNEYKFPDESWQVRTIVSNKTKAEELFYLVLRAMGIEIYGFKTISDALDNLRSMNAVLTREVKTGKSKKVYFLNPLIINHIAS